MIKFSLVARLKKMKYQKTFLTKPEKIMFQDLSVGQLFCTNTIDDEPDTYMKVSVTRACKLSGGSNEFPGEGLVTPVREIPNNPF